MLKTFAVLPERYQSATLKLPVPVIVDDSVRCKEATLCAPLKMAVALEPPTPTAALAAPEPAPIEEKLPAVKV